MKRVERDRELTRRIMEEHHALQGLLRVLRGFIAGESTGSEPVTSMLGRQLRDLREHLESHFELEEKGGLFEDLLDRQPRLDRVVGDLQDDHTRFLEEIRKILRRLEASEENDVSALRATVKELVHNLDEHEATENHLLQRSYHDESGTVD